MAAASAAWVLSRVSRAPSNRGAGGAGEEDGGVHGGEAVGDLLDQGQRGVVAADVDGGQVGGGQDEADHLAGDGFAALGAVLGGSGGHGDGAAVGAGQVDGLPAPDGALHAVNDALTRTPAVALLGWDPEHGPHRVQAHPTEQIVDHALAVLAADAADLLTGPDAERLAACASAPCRRYLLRTHARRHWCSVRCGDRARAARAYARRTRAEGD